MKRRRTRGRGQAERERGEEGQGSGEGGRRVEENETRQRGLKWRDPDWEGTRQIM